MAVVSQVSPMLKAELRLTEVNVKSPIDVTALTHSTGVVLYTTEEEAVCVAWRSHLR